jgi:hypothetical protein
VIFNTAETVILTGTEDGQGFKPSVIAPFSRVELHSDAVYMEGQIVANTFATTGSNPSALYIQGKSFHGNFTCDPDAVLPEVAQEVAAARSEHIKYKAPEVCKATGKGDPHMVTFDGIKYDVHAKGEVILVKSLNSTFEIQGRMENSGNKRRATGPAVTSGVVIKEDETKNLPTIEVSAARSAESENAVLVNNCPVLLFVDGVSKSLTDGTGTEKATVDVLFNRRIEIEYPETNLMLKIGVKINVAGDCVFNIDYILADCRREEHLVGLLGTPNGEFIDDWMTRNGTVLNIPNNTYDRYLGTAYNYTVENWCISEESESNFNYESGTDFDYFEKCDLP